MKLKIPINRNNNINKKIFNTIKIKQANIDIDFFHNKLLNNIIEISHFDEGILGIYKLNNKNSNKVMSFKTNLKKVNSAIIKSKQPFRINLSNSKVRIIKNNNFFNQSKIYRNKTDDKYKFFSKSLNNIKNSINSVNNSINVSTIIHSKHKDNKSKKYVKILEKKMKEKLSKIVNIDDVNCCYHKKVKKEENTKNNDNKIVTYLIEANKSINPFPKRVSQYEKQQIFIHNLFKYIKEEVKTYFIQNGFSSIKEYFNDWLFYKRNNQDKNKSYLDINEIYVYLKEKICLNIAKEYVNLIFNDMKFDIKNFKNFFFEENSGKISFIINNNCFLEKLNSEFANKNNKDYYTLSPNSSYFLKNTQNNFNIKFELLFRILKENRAKLLDKICDGNTDDNKIEYSYNEFYKLIESLKLDKELCEPKIVKKIFLKYQNKNKLNIKNFINVLYGNQIIENKDYLDKYKTSNLEATIDKINKNNNLLLKEKSQIINEKLNMNKNNNISNSKSNYQKKFNSYMNKNTDGSSERNTKYIKSKNRFFRKKIDKFRMKSLSPSDEQRKIFNKSANNKYNKKIPSKIDVLSNRKIFSFSDKNTKENSINSLISSNREDKKIKKDSKRINLRKKPKKEKIIFNKFKSIRIKGNYKLNKDIDKDYKNKINNLNRPSSSYNKIEKYLNKMNNYSNLMESQITKISKESRIQNLNSDIIDLI